MRTVAFIERLKQLMERERVSQKWIAQRINYNENSFGSMLARGDMKVSTLIKVANLFKVPVCYFFSSKTSNPNVNLLNSLKSLEDENQWLRNQMDVQNKILKKLVDSNFNKSYIEHLFRLQNEYKAVCITNSNREILYVNDHYTEQTGYTNRDVEGKKASKVLHKDNFPVVKQKELRHNFNTLNEFYSEIPFNYSKSGIELVSHIHFTKTNSGYISFGNYTKV